MMRTRLLKPGFFRNVTLGQMSDGHRLLFAGLWLLADREGRLPDDPAWIRAELFPYKRGRNVETMLADLAHQGLIIRYVGPRPACGKAVENSPTDSSDNMRFVGFAKSSAKVMQDDPTGCKTIFIPTFFRHQRPHLREAASVLPAPPFDLTPIVGPTTEGNAKAAPRHNLGTAHLPLILDPVCKDLKAGAGKNRPPTSTPADAGAPTPSAEEPKPEKPASPDEPDRNLSIITKIAHEAIGLLGLESPELPDTIKYLCASRQISYNSSVVGKALDSARVQQQRIRQSHDAH